MQCSLADPRDLLQVLWNSDRKYNFFGALSMELQRFEFGKMNFSLPILRP